jgi:hypothetical protein
VPIDGIGDMDEVTERVLAAIEARRTQNA